MNKTGIKRLALTGLYAVVIFHALRHQLPLVRWFLIPTLIYLMLLIPPFAAAWGAFVSRLVLTLIYLLALPLGLGVRLFSDPLRVKFRAGESYWIARAEREETLESAARQG